MTTMHTVWLTTLNPLNGATCRLLAVRGVVRWAGSRGEPEGGARRRATIMKNTESTWTSGERSEMERSEVFTGAT